MILKNNTIPVKLQAALLLLSVWLPVFYFREGIVEFFIYRLLRLEKESVVSQGFEFFLTTGIKIFLLLILVIFLMAFLRSWFSISRVRDKIVSMSLFRANVFAGLAGVITPFCSCSAVPMFIGFLEAGIPLYACSAAVAPVAFAFVDKGMPIGTALAFTMAVAGLSLPEMVMLKKVLSLRLILIFAFILTMGIIITGYLFNMIL